MPFCQVVYFVTLTVFNQGSVKAQKPPRPVPMSLQILRRRVLEEMRAPGQNGQPRFRTDAQLARFLNVDPSHVSHFLRARNLADVRGVSWTMVDKLAAVFELQIWQLFFVSSEPYKWKSR